MIISRRTFNAGALLMLAAPTVQTFAEEISMTNYRPEGYTTVTPWIISEDTAGVLAFAKAAFGAVELSRVPNPPGNPDLKPNSIGHAEMRIGDAVVMLFDSPVGWAKTPAFLRLYVEDADAVYARAIAAGAEEVTRVTQVGFGDKVARLRDPFGNIWWLQQHVEDVAPDELARRWTDPEWAEPMAYVQSSLIAAKP